MIQKLSLFLAAAILSIHASASLAQGYMGVQVGQADMNLDILSKLDTSTSVGVYGGYSINKYFAVELSYSGYGDEDVNYSGPGALGDLVAPRWTVSSDSLSFHGLIKAPFDDGLTLYAKAGWSMWDVEFDVNDAPRDGYEDSSSNGTDFSYGLGVMFDASRHVSLRLDYTAVTTDKSSANISVGVQYNL